MKKSTSYFSNKFNFLRFLFFILIISACSSPETDGRKAVINYINYEKAVIEYRQKNYSRLLENFNRHNFQTRTEVRQMLQEIDNNAVNTNNRLLQNAEQYHRKTLGKYATNFTQNVEFEYSFRTYRNSQKVDESNIVLLLSQINNIILSITPPLPNIEKIKNDLSGREIREQPDGYFNQNRRWLIEKDKIIDFQIINEYSRTNDHVFQVYLIFQRENGFFEAKIDITYVLGQNDDWTIDVLASKELNIVRTGRYDNYITTRITGWSGEYSLELTNHSNVNLVVGGVVFMEFRREWRKFSALVESNGRRSVGGLFFGSVIDYNIHFIERP